LNVKTAEKFHKNLLSYHSELHIITRSSILTPGFLRLLLLNF